jgi:coenzyme F420 hydrogenase subunit beta
VVGRDAGLPATGDASPLRSVITGGFCIGCGACAFRTPSAISMVPGRFGMSVALVRPGASEQALEAAAAVCPFATQTQDETEPSIAQPLFGDGAVQHPELGFVLDTFAARVVESDFRERGSSGGLGTWLPLEMMRLGLADGVVHVHASDESPGADGPLFRYAISVNPTEVREGAKSRYHPVSLEEVLTEVVTTGKRYVFVGVPCFIKALRLLARQDPRVEAGIAFCVGLVCGHLKTRRFAELLAWQMGIAPDALKSFDFRSKLAGLDANQYGVTATGAVGGVVQQCSSPVRDLYGYDWGLGFFKPKACDYCDDVVAELADVTVGDAWLPQYVADSGGTNVVVVRSRVVAKLMADAVAAGRVWREPLTAADVVQSQASGFSHRRQGLAYRLWAARQRGEWVPHKRVAPASFADDPDFRRKHDLRMAVARESHLAFREARERRDLRIFFRRMAPIVEAYRDLGRSPLRKVAARVRRLVKRFSVRGL